MDNNAFECAMSLLIFAWISLHRICCYHSAPPPSPSTSPLFSTFRTPWQKWGGGVPFTTISMNFIWVLLLLFSSLLSHSQFQQLIIVKENEKLIRKVILQMVSASGARAACSQGTNSNTNDFECVQIRLRWQWDDYHDYDWISIKKN